jgi:hypothetical protein
VLNAKLKELVEKIQNNDLRSKVTDFLENPTFSLDGKVYSGPSFDVSPGGLAHHHTYEGGTLSILMQHGQLRLHSVMLWRKFMGAK